MMISASSLRRRAR
ncbi:hypothetical protein D018_0478A, partial [Vibrio parahaemolyticus VP2007-007]